MQRAEGSSDSSGRDLTYVHGCQSGAQTTEYADDQPANNDQLKRLSQDWQSHQTPTK